MALVWTPDNSTPLYTGSETTTFPKTFVFSVVDDDPGTTEQPTIVSITLNPPIPSATISADSITFNDFVGLYPFIVKTVNPTTLEIFEYNNTFNFPLGQKIIKYQKDQGTPKTLTITATTSTGISNVYEIIVQGDYSLNIAALQDAVARSNLS